MREEVGFWLAVAIVAVVGVILFKFAAVKVGDRVPGLAQLGTFI